jgi:hypothetical protein
MFEDFDGHLTREILKSYLVGGTTFPQIRGSINIALLKELLTHYDLSRVIAFFDFEFSAEQLEIVKNSMNRLHEIAGITISDELVEGLIKREWKRSQGGVMISLLRLFFDDISLSTRGRDLETYIHQENIQQLLEFQNSLVFPSRFVLCQNMAFISLETMIACRDLAELYRFCLFSDKNRELALKSKQETFLQILEKYNLSPFLLVNPIECKTECLATLVSLIQDKLRSHHYSLRDCECLLWGF